MVSGTKSLDELDRIVKKTNEDSEERSINFVKNSVDPKWLLIYSFNSHLSVVQEVVKNPIAPQTAMSVIATRIIKSNGNEKELWKPIAQEILKRDDVKTGTKERLKQMYGHKNIFFSFLRFESQTT